MIMAESCVWVQKRVREKERDFYDYPKTKLYAQPHTISKKRRMTVGRFTTSTNAILLAETVYLMQINSNLGSILIITFFQKEY